MINNCPYCWPIELVDGQEILFETGNCVFIRQPQEVLVGSGLIVPKNHKETVFDLSDEEIQETFELLRQVKELTDRELSPQGYSVGWNCYPVGGQTIPHAHFHVIPRFEDEPLAGKGIRHYLKQNNNKRPINSL
jgi:diadenosine tetraphosphate (Ap4A) HIT family hydrolase